MAGQGHTDDAGGAGRVEDPQTPSTSRARGGDDADLSSRRDFLKLGGIAAAGLAVGGGVGAAAGAAIAYPLGYREGSIDLGAVPARSEPGFDHVVVIMGENRSFDNLLGWLYTPETLPDG